MGLALTARQFCYELTGIVVSSPNRWCHSPFMKSDGRTDAQMHTASRGVKSENEGKIHLWVSFNCLAILL